MKVQRDGRRFTVEVASDGEGLVSHAGAALLAEAADRCRSGSLGPVELALGDHVGKDVRIISISVDPTVDTPRNLNAYAKALQAGPGWYFLTGDKQNVDFALNKIGQLVGDKRDHTNIIIVGNERTGLWKKAFGLARSDELIKVVESVLNDRPSTAK